MAMVTVFNRSYENDYLESDLRQNLDSKFKNESNKESLSKKILPLG